MSGGDDDDDDEKFFHLIFDDHPISPTSSSSSSFRAPSTPSPSSSLSLGSVPSGLSKWEPTDRDIKSVDFWKHKRNKMKEKKRVKAERLEEARANGSLGPPPEQVIKKIEYRALKEQWKERSDISEAMNDPTIIVDCAYNHLMSFKEVKKLTSQFSFLLAAVRKSERPLRCNVLLSNDLLQLITEKSGNGTDIDALREKWAQLIFHVSPPATLLDFATPTSSVEKKLVYLSPDASDVLYELDPNCIYCIGGIVDKNRLFRASLNRANSLGIQAVRLPIEEVLEGRKLNNSLTAAHVYSILAKVANGQSWKEAFNQFLPERMKK